MDKKKNQGRRAQRQEARKKRRLMGVSALIGLVVLTLLAVIFFGSNLMTSQPESQVIDRASDPTASGAPEAVKEKTTAKNETTTNNETTTEQATTEQATTEQATNEPTTDEQTAEAQTSDENQYADENQNANQGSAEDVAAAPSDPTMHLSIPKLGISGALVTGSEAGLESGTEDVSGYPWLPGSNTYIAGHRLGFPGTGSDHIFYNLPSMAPGDDIHLTDANGHTYNYKVSEILQVDPSDLGVLAPTGTDTVSLQTCIEDYGDFTTLGPDWNVRLIVRGTRV